MSCHIVKPDLEAHQQEREVQTQNVGKRQKIECIHWYEVM